ncbi:MAG: tetratricopeptide repeat protein [Gemmatimonadota bacterium]|nr:MAG: tetratricopeptide repeat protein [Gemmatimonadota bacterium]
MPLLLCWGQRCWPDSTLRGYYEEGGSTLIQPRIDCYRLIIVCRRGGPMFTLRLLGGLTLEGPSGPVSGRVAQRRRLALLALLGVAGEKGVSRDKLVGYLWPESDEASARHLLSDTLYVLRKGLGEDAIVASGEFLRLSPEVVECDVRGLEKALAKRELERAIGLYGGTFLDGFYLGAGAEEFERWVEAERTRLAARHAEVLEELAEGAERAGEHRAAAGWWQRLAAHDPYNSRAILRFMQALAAAGDPANALEILRVHELRLRDEVGIELPEDLRAFAERLQKEPGSGGAQARKAWQSVHEPAPTVQVELTRETLIRSQERTGLRRVVHEIRDRSLWQVLLVYSGAAWACFQLIATVADRVGLPAWLPDLAIVLFLLGLWFVFAKAFVQESTPPPELAPESEIRVVEAEAVVASYATRRRDGSSTWRNAGLSFLVALAVWSGVAAGWMSFGGGAAETSAIAKERPSLAALPFLNRSGLEEDRYFTDGIHDEILTQLSKIGGLSVRGRTSVMQYRDTQKTLRQIGDELNARYILGGGVQRVGTTVRINVRLADIRSDEQIWAETYDRPLTVENLLGVQSEIALRVAEVLKTTLTPEETQSVLSKPTDNLEAYNSYLLGRFAWIERTGDGLTRAIGHFEAAIERDSLYALAYAGLADCYSLLPYYTDWLPEQVFPRAATLASMALERDSTLAEAYVSLAYVYENYYWDWDTAGALYRRGVRLNPNYATGHHWYGTYLSQLGHHDEAVEEVRRAQELDPFSMIINRNLADVLYYARRYDQAIEQYQHAFQLDSTFIGIAEHRGKAYLLLGRFEDAVRQLESVGSPYLGAPYLLAYAYAVSGYEEEARRMLQTLIEQEHIPLHSWFLALVYSGLGDNDLAFEYLERALRERDPRISYLKIEPFLDNLRSDPRYTALLRRLGLE